MDHPSEKSYRLIHEAFISNHTGSSPAECYFTVMPVTISPLILQYLITCSLGHLTKKIWLIFLLEFSVLVLPQLFALTILSDYLRNILLIIFTFATAIMWTITRKFAVFRKRNSALAMKIPINKRSMMSNLRSVGMIITFICILAVDFSVFPRRFAKTEKYGFSLMDVGVGFFILSNALVAKETSVEFQVSRKVIHFRKSLLSSVPLLVLGFVRLFATSATDYQTHVTEYGIHCNFFFILAFTKVLSSFIFMFMSSSLSGILAVIVIVGHEIVLHLGFKNFIFNGYSENDFRDDLLSANREGVAACISYLSLYFAGVYIGIKINKLSPVIKEWNDFAWKMFQFLLVMGICSWLCHQYVDPVSRRLGNLTYTLWVIFEVISVLFALVITEILLSMLSYSSDDDSIKDKKISQVPMIMEAVNFNALFLFLAANILTGLINIFIQTVFVSTFYSMCILILYLFVIHYTAIVFYNYKIKVKFW